MYSIISYISQFFGKEKPKPQPRQPTLTQRSTIKDIISIKKLFTITPFSTELTENDVVNMICEYGAFLEGHLELYSGKHCFTLLRAAYILRNNDSRDKLSHEMAIRFASHGVDAVVSPTTSGAFLGDLVARKLNVGIYYVDVDEKTGQPLSIFIGGYKLSPNEPKKVLIVDAQLDTSTNLAIMAQAVRNAGSIVVGVCIFANQFEGDMEKLVKDLGVPNISDIQYLINLNGESFWHFDPSDCPRCRDHIPLTHISKLAR